MLGEFKFSPSFDAYFRFLEQILENNIYTSQFAGQLVETCDWQPQTKETSTFQPWFFGFV